MRFIGRLITDGRTVRISDRDLAKIPHKDFIGDAVKEDLRDDSDDENNCEHEKIIHVNAYHKYCHEKNERRRKESRKIVRDMRKYLNRDKSATA